MGQKYIQPVFALASSRTTSVWFADKKHYAEYLLNDLEVRQYLRDRLADASVGRIEIALTRADCSSDHPHRSTRHRHRQER